MKRSCVLAAAVGAMALAASAGVTKVSVAPKIDGALDEAVWQNADWEGDFRLVSRMAVARGDALRKPTGGTQFAMAADDRNLYVAIKAEHKSMAEMLALRAGGQWASEAVELILAPSEGQFEFYQFLVAHPGQMWAMFYSEGGGIKPDPFGPLWERAFKDGPDGWTAEVRIPFSAFYMTRNSGWHGTWRMNVGRTYKTATNSTGEHSCWCDVEAHYTETRNFRSFGPFPARRPEDDVCVQSLVADVRGLKDGRAYGEIRVAAYLAKGGAFRVETPYSEPTEVTLKDGDNVFALPATFPSNGRYDTKITLVRTADGSSFGRVYPMLVDYQPVRVKFSTPQYRDNFYPGQDASRVRGVVKTVAAGPVTLVLEGPGFEKQSIVLSRGGEFSFDTTGFEYGDATLTATCGKDVLKRRVRRLPPLPEGEHASWVENGNLVVDGRPTVMRNIYAEGFAGGKALDAKYKADDKMHITRHITQMCSLDPAWFARDLKYSEMREDRKPSAKMLAALEKKLSQRNKAGVYYYGLDEPECHGISEVYLRHYYDYMAEKDPYRVIMSCCRSGDTYVHTADVFPTHPYLNAFNRADGTRGYVRDFNRLGSFVDAFHPEQRPDKCIGGAPTCFTYSGGDYPTFEEYVLNYWCEFVRGAKVMLPYAYHDLGDRPQMYEGTRYMFESIEALEDVILYGTRKTLAKSEEGEVCLWTLPAGDRVFAALNFTQKPQTVKAEGLYGCYREFRGTRTFNLSSQPSTFNLQPLESLIACERTRDAGLKTFAAVKAEIDALEYERTHRDNQLFERSTDMDVTASSGRRGPFWDTPVELFDGTRDVLGWYQNGGDKFYQLLFKNGLKPTFREVRLYGTGLDGYTVSVPDGKGGWTKLAPAETREEGLCRTLVFDDAVTPTGVRFEFPARNVEVYEIELPAVKR